MDRRSFFRFAVGGVAAAPLSLVGEAAVPSRRAIVGEVGAEITMPPATTVRINIQAEVDRLLNERIVQSLRGAMTVFQSRNA